MPVFLNLSNHPSAGWSDEQLSAARAIGRVTDMPFPTVPPDAGIGTVMEMADRLVSKILAIADCGDLTVHLMGEMTLTVALVRLLQRAGVRVVASTTIRDVVPGPDGTRMVRFRFVRFRDYPMP